MNTRRRLSRLEPAAMEESQPMSVALTAWQQLSLQRLHYLFEQTPEAAPVELSPLEAWALLEWARMAVFAECHSAGVGQQARTMLRGQRRQLIG